MAELSVEAVKKLMRNKGWTITDVYEETAPQWVVTANTEEDIRIVVDEPSATMNNVFIEKNIQVTGGDEYRSLESTVEETELYLTVLSEEGIFLKAKESETDLTDAELVDRLEAKDVGYGVRVKGAFKANDIETIDDICSNTVSLFESLNL